MKLKSIILTGGNLSISDIFSLTGNSRLKTKISQKNLAEAQKTRKFLEEVLKKNHRVIYGINTGFGPMATYILPAKDLIKLQYNLVFSHAVGMGNKLPDEFVLAAMAVRLNTLAKGYSGVSKELLKQLENFINFRIIPIVPEHGAVGTSGDLVQLAHIALALIGEGRVSYQNKLVPAAQALKQAGLAAYKLKPKEGLSLINGTSMMTGIAALVCKHAEKLLDLSLMAGCLALEIIEGYDDSFSEKLHALRPHSGQMNIAEKMRRILKTSKRIKNRQGLNSKANNTTHVNHINEMVQEVYSMRCVAQILGPINDSLEKAKRETETEMNSVTDNPILDIQNKKFLHGGNFHGEYIAEAMDHLKTSLVKLTMLSERRINFFLNPNINKNLPPFLNLDTPGLTLALQGLQFVATSTTANSQTLAFPMSAHSISTNGDNQDVVSMGTDAALFANKVVENAYIVLAIEMIALCQAVDYLKIQNKLAQKTGRIYSAVRKQIPVILKDNEITLQLTNLTQMLKK